MRRGRVGAAGSPSASDGARSVTCTAIMPPHFNFPKTVWAELMQDGRIGPHPVFPDAQGPAAHGIESEEDIRDVIALLRLNYDRVGGGDPDERRGGRTR